MSKDYTTNVIEWDKQRGPSIKQNWAPDDYMRQPDGQTIKEINTRYVLVEEDGNVRVKKIVTERKFYGEGNYIDSTSDEYLT